MKYLTFEDIVFIHESLLETYGGEVGIRDAGLIEVAVKRPQTGHYADLIEQAAALWESLATTHCFVDCNERTAFAAMEIFLDLNGMQITASEEEAKSFIQLLLANGNFSKDNLDFGLRQNTAAN